MTLTDETPLAGEIPAVMDGLTPDQPFQDFANRIVSTLRKYTRWQPTSAVGGRRSGRSRQHYGRHSSPLSKRSPTDNVAVSSWTALAVWNGLHRPIRRCRKHGHSRQ